MTAPTSTKGFVDPYALGANGWASLYTDLLEHVPDLLFPTSIPVYSRMRRDPKLSSIVSGWTLNLRRAQWQLDPAGCRPEVVRLVADGMGLAVVGKDEPGPARLRGVSWGDHLGAVLRMVPFGFAAFELEAEVAEQAQLAGLWERPQWTIEHLHVNGKTGLLEGVTQDRAANLKAPQIPARNLAFYVREREGSNWAGTSLLRASYASWLIKEEVRRAYGAANVRWTSGVPVMEAQPGTSPTTAQMTEAMQMAAALRFSNAGGAASPPGFTLRIKGIEGGLPDSQEFLRYLDQQMTASAMMGAFDLGETPNGSRALGSVFVDALHLALEAEAELVADIATRQIAARIVDWNHGEDEPVPRVVVSGVGSRREVTAESLKMLVESGALLMTPEIQEWVCREYRLPVPDEAARPVKAPGTDLAEFGAATEPQPVAAAARSRSSRRKPAKQQALFGDGEDPDRAAQRIQQQWQAEKDRLLKRWPLTAKPMVAELTEQARAAVEAGDLGLLGQLSVSAGVVAAVSTPLRQSGSKLAQEAASGVVQEAASQGVDIGTVRDAGADRVVQTADAVAGVIASGYASGAARIALQLAGLDPQAVRDAVDQHLTDLGTSTNGLVGDNVGALLSAAQHAGRLAVLEEHPADEYEASERNEQGRCDACRKTNGRRYLSLAEALKDYPASGLVTCEGRSRCRGFLMPIWN